MQKKNCEKFAVRIYGNGLIYFCSHRTKFNTELRLNRYLFY